jgi:hypothetical protein
VGRLVAAQGLQGEVRLNPLSDFPERFTVPGQRWLQGRTGPARPVTLLAGRQLPGKELYVLRLEGVNDRSSAEALVGHALLVPASDRPPLAEGEFHLLDLVATGGAAAGGWPRHRPGHGPAPRRQRLVGGGTGRAPGPGGADQPGRSTWAGPPARASPAWEPGWAPRPVQARWLSQAR